VGLNRERAEAYLRLVAEGELCRTSTFPQAAAAAALYGLPRLQREAIALQQYACLPESETARAIRISVGAVRAHTARGMAELHTALEADTRRVAEVAQVLTAVGALDDGIADQILHDFALAQAIRRAGPAAQRSPDPGSLLRSSAVRVPLAMLMNCRSRAAAAARSAGPGTAPYRAVPGPPGAARFVMLNPVCPADAGRGPRCAPAPQPARCPFGPLITGPMFHRAG